MDVTSTCLSGGGHNISTCVSGGGRNISTRVSGVDVTYLHV